MIYQPFQNDTLAAQQLINNEIDQALDLRPLVVASLLAQADHLLTWTGKQLPFGYVDWWPTSVYFNTAKAPTDNPKVRWAVSLRAQSPAVGRCTGWGGAGKLSVIPFPEYPKLMTFVDGIKDILDKYNMETQDLDKSVQLMKKPAMPKMPMASMPTKTAPCRLRSLRRGSSVW
jgi:peptide/nickel transport system substrate-binding protein